MATLSDTNTATVRSGWNIGIFTAVAALIYKITGWHVQLDDLLPYAPAIAIVGGVFYRLSRVISDKVTWLGYVLFGNRKAPSAYVEPPKES